VRLGKLNAKFVQNAKQSGLWGDGGGLYLQVGPGSKSWVFRYERQDREHQIGLGSANAVDLARARRKAAEQRTLLAEGHDPLEAKRTLERASREASAKKISFGECAERYIEQHRHEWRNEKHANQWTNTINTYCVSILETPVSDIDTPSVLRVLSPVWNEKRETAVRLRGRIERILDAAKALGFREGDNPARRENLRSLLAKDKRGERVLHHRALPFQEVPALVERLHAERGTAARALEFCILTAARTNEVIGARWDEVDLDAGAWVVPASRMKAKRPHRVPLAPEVVKLLRGLPRTGEFVFPGRRRGQHLSNMAMLTLLKRGLSVPATTHGFRSCFRVWSAERTNYPREVAEACLAHTLGDATEIAYLRTDLFQKRQRLMADWAKFCYTLATFGKVLQLGEKKARAAAQR